MAAEFGDVRCTAAQPMPARGVGDSTKRHEDLSLTNNDAKGGGHALLRNRTTPRGRLLAVQVLDERGRMTRAGAEVRVYVAGTRTLAGSGLVDTGSGYCSQNAMPVFVAAPPSGLIDVEVIMPAPADAARRA